MVATGVPLGLTAIDLFAGAGGLSEGFRQAGFEITYALDRDLDSCETYRLNHPGTKLDQLSITDRTPKAFARLVGEVDVIIGGPSCQGFSTHGRRDPKDERNKLWRHMRHLVKAIRPKAFLLENVPGINYAHDGRTSIELIMLFERSGYTVHRATLLAANYGVPQLRHRVFVVGVRDGYDFSFPEPAHWGGWRRDTIDVWERDRQARGKLPHIPCWDALGDLPTIGDGVRRPWQPYGTFAPSDYAALMRAGSDVLRDHEASVLGEAHRELVKQIPPGGTWRDIPAHRLPDRYRGMRRTDSTNLLGRLDPERPAYTITTQYNNVTAGCFTHPIEDRALSVREGARLQSFPDRYRFVGSISSRCRQIGNAVPPLLAQQLACAIAEAIDAPLTPTRPLVVTPTARPPTAQTHVRMVRQPRRDTAPELALRRQLHARGLRYRVAQRPIDSLRREADIVCRPDKVAIFVQGCFWHGCPTHSRATKSNTKWWADKISKNKTRDDETRALLEAHGWHVEWMWEHEDPATAADRIVEVVQRRRAQRIQPRRLRQATGQHA